MFRRTIHRLQPFFAVLALLVSLCTAAHGYVIIDAPMTDANAAGWVVGGNPTSAVLTGDGSTDPVGSGWLRLTNNTTNQTGFAYNTTSFDLSAGVLIQFDYATWGGTGADGYSVYLFDANIPAFNPGAFGGSLGYAQKTGIPGLSGGYVGIGVDEFGNFANPTEGRYRGTGFRPNTVTIRGQVVGFGGGAIGQTQSGSSYPWIATSSTSPSSLWYNGASRPGQYGSEYRKVIIRISPAPNPVADVWVQYGYNSTPVQMISGRALPAISASQQLKIGYAASTGASTNYHEIRNLLITSVNATSSVNLGITNETVATGTSTPITSALVGDTFQYLITARNYGPNGATVSGVGIVDTLPSYLTPGSWSCSAAGGASCGASSGSGNLNATATIPRNGSVTYRVNATLNAMPPGNQLSNTATLVIPPSVSDYYAADNSASDTISGYAPPVAVKTFTPATILPGDTSTLSITLQNPNNIDATAVTFRDNYPTTPGAMRNDSPASRTNSCGGSSSGYNGGSYVRLYNSSNRIPANGSCTVTIKVTASTYGSYLNSTGLINTGNLGTGAAGTATLVVMRPPTAAASFAPAEVGANGDSVYSVTVTNPNAAPITDAAFTATFPANLLNGATPDAAVTCTGTGGGGTVSAAPGGNSVALSGATIPGGGSCTVTVGVAPTAAGSFTVSTGNIGTGNSGTGSAAQATLRALVPPTVSTGFNQGTILPGGSSVLSVTIANPNNVAVTGASFNDGYPGNITNTAAPAASISCSGSGGGGTVSTSPGGNSLALSGGTIPANGSCTVSVNVTGAVPGSYTNSTGTVGTQNAAEAPPATGTLVVMAPPTATKSFAPNQVPIGGTTSLAVTLTNLNSVAISGAAFTDNYPAGMRNSAAPAGTISCTGAGGGGTVTAAADGSSLSLAGGTIPANGSCTVTANVTVSGTGPYVNSIGSFTTANSGTAGAVTASLNGPQPPSVAVSFAPAGILLNGESTLSVTFANPNSFAMTGVSFTDSYPAGFANGATPAGAISCSGGAGGGTVTAAAGGSSLSLSGGTIPAGGNCTVTVQVTGLLPGNHVNSTGTVSSTNSGSAAAATGTLAVMAPPTAILSFAPASILVNTSSVMTVTLTNPAQNPAAVTGLGLTDNYPAGLLNTAAANPTTTCSGGSVGAANGGASLTLSGATIPPGGSCSVSVRVTSASAGSYTNSTGPLTSGNAGTGAAAQGTLEATLLPAPLVTAAFAPARARAGGTSLFTVTLANPGTTAITGAGFTDIYPAGLTNGAPSAGSSTCPGATVTAAAGGTSLALSGASIPAGGSCTVTVNVTGVAGSFANSTGTVTSSNAHPAAAALATLELLAPPMVAATFTPATAFVNTPSQFSVTLTNPNGVAITGAAFSQSYPAGLVNGATPAGSSTCPGAMVTAAAGGGSLALSGATIPAGGSCTVTVNVQSASVGSYSTTTGPVSTENAGTGAAAGAVLTTTRLPAPTAMKSFAPTQIARNGTSVVSITLNNAAPVPVTGVAFSDILPATPGQMSIAASSVLSNSCGGTGTIAANKLSFSLSGGTIPANGSCSVTVTVTAGTLGTYNNSTSTVTSSNAATAPAASASLTVALLAPPAVQKSFAPHQIGIGETSTLSITLTNPNSTAITGAGFTDSYPAGLSNTASPNASTTCGAGTVTAAAAGASLSLSGAVIPANGSCTVSVRVTAAAAGGYLNSTGAVSTANASAGASASATLNVLKPPAAGKAFLPAAIAPSGTSLLTVTLTNTNDIAITGVSFTDNYPAGLFNGAATAETTCIGGTVSAAAGGGALALSGATIPGGGSCTVTVNVKSAQVGSTTNTTGPLTSGNAGTGSPASGVLVVMAPPTAAMAFTPSQVQTGAPALLTVTLSNPNAADVVSASFSAVYPAGLANAASPGAGTTCPGGTVSAAPGGGSLQLSGASIPAGGSCTVTVTAAGASPGSFNTSTGSIGTGNAGSGSAATATIDLFAPPTAAKAFGAGTAPVGTPVLLELTLANPAGNGAALTGVQVDDDFPAGMTLRSNSFSFAPAGCGSVTGKSGSPASPGDVSVRFGAASLSPGESCRVTLQVTVSTAGAVVNTTAAPAASGPAALTGAGASASLTLLAQPLISILKSADRSSVDPGQDVVYSVELVNSGEGEGASVVVTDVLSPYVSLYLGSGAPFVFSDGSPPSGLSLGTPQYSRDGGASWGYTPITGGGGAPAGFDGRVTNWRIPMSGTIRPGGRFRIAYEVKVK